MGVELWLFAGLNLAAAGWLYSLQVQSARLQARYPHARFLRRRWLLTASAVMLANLLVVALRVWRP